MKFIDASGKPRTLKLAKKYLIDWDSPSRSKFQRAVKDFLKPYWLNDVVFEELRIVGTRLSIDIYNANKKIAIEVQGKQHTTYVKHFHKNRLKYFDQLKRDQKKLDFCNMNAIKLIEIYSASEINTSFFEEQEVYL
jgi:hypothetical protein